MAKNYMQWKTKGMNRDTSVSAFSQEFAFENVNLRLATNEGNTMMSWVNEKGTKEMRLDIDNNGWSSAVSDRIMGIPVGTAVLNHKLVVFTVDGTTSYIYTFESSDSTNYDFKGKVLYCGNLGFDAGYPLETLVSYESEDIQKVYWTDNKNQPRFINISPYMDSRIEDYNDHSFDFVEELALQENVSVQKIFGTGEFPPGVIQYAFTYYNKYGQESNIFYTTPLQYISYVDRGGSPESKVANSFKITVENIDDHFDYLRIYSILRTSKDATPLVKRVADISLSSAKETALMANALSMDGGIALASDIALASSSSNLDSFGQTMTITMLTKISQITDSNNGYYVQGAAAYGKYLFQAYIAGKYIDVVDLETNERVATLSTDITRDFNAYHGNVLSFGKELADGSDFPYLYYACESTTAPCILVIKISNSGSTWSGSVVQRIYLPASANGASQADGTTGSSSSFTHYYQNGCVDAENNCIWVSGYTMDSYNSNTDSYADNTLVYRKYALPTMSGSNVYFSAQDVQDSFTLPFKKGTQGMVIKDNKLYQCYGYDKNDIYDEYLDCIDLSAKQVTKSYNFPKEQLAELGEELESPYIYNDNLYLSATCNNWRYYTLWNIAFSSDSSSSGGDSSDSGSSGSGDSSSGGSSSGGDSSGGTIINPGTGTGGGVIVDPDTDSGSTDTDTDTTPDPYPDTDDTSDTTSGIAVSFIDNGLQGETIDPTELLYKGGEEIRVKTIEQKDGTLFLGNITVLRPSLEIKDDLLSANDVSKESPLANSNVVARSVARTYKVASKAPLSYINTLDSSDKDTYQGASCFKSREYYRLGVQFQYKNGKWSEPCWIGDKQCNAMISMDEANGILTVPEFRYNMQGVFNTLYKQGYRKVRPVFVAPGSQDRTILCQGIGAPTMYRNVDREGALYGSASWLFRTYDYTYGQDWNISGGGGYVVGSGSLAKKSQYGTSFLKIGTDQVLPSPYLSSTEVMGVYSEDDAYNVDAYLITINSPDIEFDDALAYMDFKDANVRTVGYTVFTRTYGDIDIQTSTPTIGSDAGGFTHRSISTSGNAALISGLFYNDYLVDDEEDTPKYGAYNTSSPAIDYPVYMWHKNGSLNNDVARDNRSAVLLKKKISNYRLGGNTIYASLGSSSNLAASDIQLFSSDELSIIKVNGKTYQGNVDTLITPSEPSPYYFVGNPWRTKVDTDNDSRSRYKLALKDPNNTDSASGVWVLEYHNNTWDWYGDYSSWLGETSKRSNIGDYVKGLDQWREGVSIKYKSTPHLVAKITVPYGVYTWEASSSTEPVLDAANAPIVEVYKSYNKNFLFGGTSDEVLQAATWIPCGPPVAFNASTQSLNVDFKWGDNYFQRFECLKTYPFTTEDKNQVVEIASFMVETRVNIDGRYDRNRAQTSNLNMSPRNFNLINPVYSQLDNFFSYKILNEDYYRNTRYPNNITWTKTKQNGADIDLWTNITLANILEMDGDKGEVNEIVRMNSQLLSFQDSGIAQILYNENTQISTTEGVPIEIANSEKVQGKRYYSDTVGCSNRWSVVQTPSGIYFMDSNDKGIYLFNGQLANVSSELGFNSWAKKNIPPAEESHEWNPKDFGNFKAVYDKLNQDVLFISKDTALAYSEKFKCFTSFYDYGGTPYFENLDDIGIWIKDNRLWRHQAGEYCHFFDSNKPFSMTLIGNQNPQMDKIFTNLEFRACVEEEGIYDSTKDKFTPTLPFDTLEAWDEYQHGKLALSNRSSGERVPHSGGKSLLARKFRMWRCDIPRDNAPVDTATESILGIKRFKARPLDRMRNPWVYLKLSKEAAKEGSFLSKTEVHDIMATYFA